MSGHTLLRDLLPPEFRPAEHLLKKTPHTFRVVMLGDSYTFGFAVTQPQSLPAQLEASLNAKSKGAIFEVLNLGRPGLNLLEELNLLRMLGAELEYDLLVLCLGDDDAHPWSRNELARFGGAWEEEWYSQWSPENPASAFLQAGLQQLKDEVGQREAQLVLAYYQSVAGSDQPLQRLRALSQQLELPFIDLLAPFARFPREQLLISSVDCHPTPFAHRIAGVELAKGLRPLLPAAQSFSEQTLEAQLTHFSDADLARSPTPGLALRHLLRLGGAKPAKPLRPQIQQWSAPLREAQNHRAGLWLLQAQLERSAESIGDLHDLIFRIHRALHLAELGGAIPADDLTPIAQAMPPVREATAALRSALTPLQDWLQNSPPPPEHPPSLSARVLQEQTHGSAQVQSNLGVLLRAHETLEGLSARPLPKPDALLSTGPGSIYAQLLDRLRQLSSALAQTTAALTTEGPSLVRLKIAVPVSDAMLNMTLYATYQMRYPYRRRAVQLQYIVMDGQPRYYDFDAPPATVGSFHFELKAFRDWAGSHPIDGTRYVERIELNGRDYQPGALLRSPI